MSALTAVKVKVVTCTSCWLHEAGHGPVPYSGPANAPIVVVGEAPGDVEDRERKPFIGQAGKLLRSLLAKAQIDPERHVGYANVVSCWPGRANKGRKYRVPSDAEQAACRPNLLLQVNAVQPKVVVLAGGTALNAFRPDMMISKDRGRPLVLRNRFPGAVVVPTYHPSAALRGAKHLEALILRDLMQVRWRWRIDAQGRWPEDCRVCHEPLDVYDENGVAWCDKHDPERGAIEKVSADPLMLDL